MPHHVIQSDQSVIDPETRLDYRTPHHMHETIPYDTTPYGRRGRQAGRQAVRLECMLTLALDFKWGRNEFEEEEELAQMGSVLEKNHELA